MNTNTFVSNALRALGMAALCTLALHAAPAKAEVYISSMRMPSQQVGIPANQTALQFQITNNSIYAVGNQVVNVYLQTWADGPTSQVFHLASSGITLGAFQSTWVNVFIPATEFGKALKGMELKGYAKLGTRQYYLDFTDNGAVNNPGPTPPADVQIGTVVTPSTQKEGAALTVQLINKGGKASSAETLKLVLTPWQDGPVGATYTLTSTVPALQPNQSVTITFHVHDIDSAGNKGTLSIGKYTQQISFWM